LFVATAEARDAEMRERISRHRLERGMRWKTLEEPLALVEKLPAAMQGTDGILIDCITLWISNLFFAHEQRPEPVLAASERLLGMFSGCSKPVYLVTNEVGSGIVPEHAMARQFRDLAGIINQKLAAAADQAYLMAAGLPLRLK
jgi:adenosylcobinamide kinase/adenosylcobinamide-phosphate guanylyltransferase